MSIENPFEQQPAVPQTPDESQRVEDIDKARAMAEAGDSARRIAAEQRQELKKPWTPKAKEELGFDRAAKELDKRAEQREERAALEYDTEKSMEGMSDEEVEAARDKIHNDERAAYQEWRKAGETASRASSIDPRAIQRFLQMFAPELVERGFTKPQEVAAALEEKAEKAKTAYFRLYDQRTAIEVALQKRWRKSEKK